MKRSILSLGVLTGFFAALVLPLSVSAATTTVYPGNMQGWGFAQETPTGSGQMVSGPGSPPLGSGSANLTVDSTGGEVLAKNGYRGLAFSELDTLKYSTYRTSGNDALAIALQFDWDNDVTDGDTTFKGRIVYEPYHTQTVQTGVWQEWDALNDSAGTGTGNWWFTRTSVSTSCTQADPCTFAQVLTLFPNSGIRDTLNPNVWLKAGSGWVGGFNGNVDALKINNDTYNFEPNAPTPPRTYPASKDDCKKDGWKTYTGKTFKNQGDCVSYVASNDRARGNPTPANNPTF